MIPWLLLTAAFALETPLVTAGSTTWSYWDQGIQPGSQWAQVSYDDSSWAVGAAPLGYGAAGLITQVGYGGNTQNRFITTWFRHEFTAANTATFSGLSLVMRRDDGVVAYLNGVEVFRDNLPGGPIDSTTLATTALNGLVDQELLRIPLDPSYVVDGDNVLAIEVHQASPSSTDLAIEASLSGWDDAGSVIRGPYLQSTGPDGTFIRWRTEGPTPSRVWIGDAPGSLTQTVDAPEPLALDHEVQISGLGPNTTKYYGVGSPDLGILVGDDFDHLFTTAPVPGAVQPFRAWALGDPGTANANQEAVRDAFAAWSGGVAPEIVLMLGDNAYNSGTDQEYQDAFFDIYPDTLRQTAAWSCIGNHDGYTAASLTQYGPYFDLFTFPTNGELGGVASATEAYYSFDYANVHFISLDSYGTDRSVGGPMYAWLEADLQATTADWVVAIWHHPPYSKGSHDSDFESQLVDMRANLLPLLESYGVDLVLGGHSHSYERSWLLDQHYGVSTTLDRALSILDEGDGLADGTYRKPDVGMNANQGAVFVVAGSSGKISGGQLNHPAMYLSVSVLGSVALDFDGDRLDAVFIDDSGLEYDRFSVTKGVATITEITGEREPMEGVAVDFSAVGVLPDGSAITSFDWSFGDGSPDAIGTDQVNHMWPGEGDWRMELTALDETGTPFTEVVIVRVKNGPPVIDPLVPPSPCDEGELITWSATATDPGGDPITYLWDFGDGTLMPGQQVDYRLGDDGPHLVTLTATDDSGASSFEQMQVICNNLPPIFQGLAHPALVAEAELTLTALYTDPGRDDTVTVDWDLEGSYPAQGDQLQHTFATTGDYTLTLTLTDDDGGQVVVNQLLTVTNGPPILDALAIPTGIQEGQQVSLVALAHEAAGEPFFVEWDFGDGQQAVGSSVNHTWADDGVFELRLTLDDGTTGGRADHFVDVWVDNAPATIDQVDVSSGALEGNPVTLAAVVSDPGASDLLTVRWTFENIQLEGQIASFTPTRDGAWSATVSVEDDHGMGESRPVVFSVSNAPPVVTGLPSDTRAFVNEPWTWMAEVSDPGQDPLTFDLSGPPGALVYADGTVSWIPDEAADGTAEIFTLLVSDDAGATAQATWTVTVGPERDGAHAEWRTGGCGCTHSAPAAGWLVVLLLPLIRRRR